MSDRGFREGRGLRDSRYGITGAWVVRNACIFLIPLLVCGCCFSSPPAEYYTLGTIQLHENHRGSERASLVTIAVGPVILPDMLKRPQIAVRDNNHRVFFSEFHKWAGILKDDIKRVVTENLTGLLASDGAAVFTDDTLMEPDYRVVINFNRFDGKPGDRVCLDAVWTLKETKRERSEVFHYQVTEPCHGRSYTDLVRTQSLAIADLSRELANKIKEILRVGIHDANMGKAMSGDGKK